MDRWRSYCFEEEWLVDASVATVWGGMVDVEAWPLWWAGLEFSRSVDDLPSGMAGKRYRTEWKGPLPYKLEVRARIREISRHALIIADIRGDIEGVCTCRIRESRRGTRGLVQLDVRTTKVWMSLLSPFLKGYFSGNHNRIMAQGMKGFTRYLARGGAA